MTPQRLAVAAVLERARAEESHLTAQEVRERMAEISGHVSRQTVYDVLEAFVRAGLVRRVGLPGMVARYESTSGAPHHHVACAVCGLVRNAPCPMSGAADLDEVGRGCGVHTEVMHVTTCRRCARRASGPEADS